MVERGLQARGLSCAQVGPIDLGVAPGACVAITGPSGSGKSLVLRMLADLVPHDGEVTLDGVAQREMPAPAWRRQVIHVAAEPAWWADTVAAHMPPHSDPEPLLAALRLAPDVLSADPAQLSTGERQRLGLIRAMLVRPKVLLLDEPTAALDSDAVERVEAALANWLGQGGAIVLTSHDAAQIARLAGDSLSIPGRSA